MVEKKQIHILYTKISQDLPEDVYKKCLIFLPDVLRDKHFRYKRWQDRAANLYSKILLVLGLQKFGFDHRSLENLNYTRHGRPYLPGTVDFNISHSGEYIICGIGKELRLGVDIEEIKPVDFLDFKDLMSEKQWTMIKNSSDPLRAFFKYWAVKESIIKADGRGLSIPLNDIIITDEMAYYENRWYLTELELSESYCANLASDQKTPAISIEYIDLTAI
jgi:4'-phosphopantetheinyl transferase